MHEDDDDLHEPEHDHLLDHDFLNDEHDDEPFDRLDDLDEQDVREETDDLLDLDDEEREHPAWFDDCDD